MDFGARNRLEKTVAANTGTINKKTYHWLSFAEFPGQIIYCRRGSKIDCEYADANRIEFASKGHKAVCPAGNDPNFFKGNTAERTSFPYYLPKELFSDSGGSTGNNRNIHSFCLSLLPARRCLL